MGGGCVNIHELLAEAAAAPLTRTIRNRAMDTVMVREGDDTVWTVKTKNLDLIHALNEECGRGRGIELSREHEVGVVRAAEYAVVDHVLAELIHRIDSNALNTPTPPVPPDAA
mgnify:CR=1 FL=1